MKTAIVTLPLHTNYGGILQAYALKTALESLGHEAEVLDIRDKMPAPSGLRAPFVYLGRMLKKVAGESSAPEVFRERRYRKELPLLAVNTDRFVRKYVQPRVIDSYRDIKEGEYDAFVVGSDQVWRPRFFHGIEDAFLAFTEGWDVRRVAYAASFGTDRLEYDYQQLERCAALLERFDGVSVREDSAVRMCAEWLDCDRAVHVLDPVLLPDPVIYMNLASGSGSQASAGRIATYILDPSHEKDNVVRFISGKASLEVCDLSVNPYADDRPVEERTVPPLEDWLAGFADAEFIVTDSFHGCVLALLMHKRFIVTANSLRGMSRLSSLLSLVGLDQRLVQGIDPEDDGTFFLSDIDWERVDAVLGRQRELSLGFLEEKLGGGSK